MVAVDLPYYYPTTGASAGAWARRARPNIVSSSAILLQPSLLYPTYNFSTIAASIGSSDVAVVANNLPANGTLILDAPGLYQWSGFSQFVNTAGCFALGVYNSKLKGILGTTTNPADTILQMVPGSSTFPVGSIPAQATALTNNITAVRCPQLGNLWLRGTDQGHNYNGFQVYGPDSPDPNVRMFDNLLVSGIPGDANSQPGETAAINLLGVNGTSAAHLKAGPNVEVSGIRYSDSALVGASPIEWNSASWIDLLGGNFHDTYTSMPTFWQSTDCTTTDLISTNCGSDGGILSGCGINMERSTRLTHNNPVATVRLNAVVGGAAMLYQHFQVNSDQQNAVVAINNPTINHPAYDATHVLFYIDNIYGSGQLTTGSLVTLNGVTIAGNPACAIYQ